MPHMCCWRLNRRIHRMPRLLTGPQLPTSRKLLLLMWLLQCLCPQCTQCPSTLASCTITDTTCPEATAIRACPRTWEAARRRHRRSIGVIELDVEPTEVEQRIAAASIAAAGAVLACAICCAAAAAVLTPLLSLCIAAPGAAGGEPREY